VYKNAVKIENGRIQVLISQGIDKDFNDLEFDD